MTRGCVTYGRVSSDAQAEDGSSLASQREALEAFCQANDLRQVEHVEDSVTGATLSRPGIKRVRELVQSGAVSVLACWSVDRLARDNYLGTGFLQWLQRHGVETVFVNEHYARTPEGELFRGMRWEFAAYERKLIRARTMRGRLKKARAGQVPVRFRLFGYQCVRKWEAAACEGKRDGELLVDEVEAAAVRLVFGWWEAGVDDTGQAVSLRRTAVRLNALGYTTVRGRPWNAVAVSGLLAQEAYCGRLWWNRTERIKSEDEHERTHIQDLPRPESEWILIPVPALVSPDTWAAVQARRAANTVERVGRPSQEFPLASVIFCGVCRRADGTPLRVGAHRASNCPGRPAYSSRSYACNSRSNRERREACGIRVNAPPLEAAVYRWALRVTAPGRLARLARQHARKQRQQDPDAASRLESVERDLRELDQREGRFLDALLSGFAVETIAAKQQELARQRAALRLQQQALRGLLAPELDADRLAETVERRAAGWREGLVRGRGDAPRLQLIYRELLRVYLLPGGRWRIELAPRVFGG